MNVRSICLAILFFDDMSGYDIRKASTEGHFSFFVDASFGSIYPALNRLETEGLVTCRRESQDGKPARKVYSITRAGIDELKAEMGQPVRQDVFRSEFLLVALFAQMLGPDVVERAIDLQIKRLEEEIELIASSKKDIVGGDDGQSGGCNQRSAHERQLYLAAAQWTQNYGCYCVQGSIDYLKKTKPALLAISRQELPSDYGAPLIDDESVS